MLRPAPGRGGARGAPGARGCPRSCHTKVGNEQRPLNKTVRRPEPERISPHNRASRGLLREEN